MPSAYPDTPDAADAPLDDAHPFSALGHPAYERGTQPASGSPLNLWPSYS